MKKKCSQNQNYILALSYFGLFIKLPKYSFPVWKLILNSYCSRVFFLCRGRALSRDAGARAEAENEKEEEVAEEEAVATGWRCRRFG